MNARPLCAELNQQTKCWTEVGAHPSYTSPGCSAPWLAAANPTEHRSRWESDNYPRELPAAVVTKQKDAHSLCSVRQAKGGVKCQPRSCHRRRECPFCFPYQEGIKECFSPSRVVQIRRLMIRLPEPIVSEIRYRSVAERG